MTREDSNDVIAINDCKCQTLDDVETVSLDAYSDAKDDLFALAEAIILLFNGKVFTQKQAGQFYRLTGEKFPCHRALKIFATQILLKHGDKLNGS